MVGCFALSGALQSARELGIKPGLLQGTLRRVSEMIASRSPRHRRPGVRARCAHLACTVGGDTRDGIDAWDIELERG
jgi:hypothetical protein